MKKTPPLLRIIFFSLVCFACPVGAQNLPSKYIRKFQGEYLGNVSGIAGNTIAGSAAVAFSSRARITGKSSEYLTPQISNLYSLRNHRIIYRRPTGNSKRAVFTGYYTGMAANPRSGAPEPVSGIRKMEIVDRGSGSRTRYTMRFSDTLREGAYAAQRISGNLSKKK